MILEDKQAIPYDEICRLTESVGWGKRFYPNAEKWKRVLASSSWIAYIKEKGKVVAFGRILEDGMMCLFYDVCVHPDYQGQGLGRQLMEHLISKVKDQGFISIGLFTWEGNPDASKFYEKLGFEHVEAMELKKYLRSFG